MKKSIFVILSTFFLHYQSQAAVPSYLSLNSNTIVCRMTAEAGCPIYANGKQQFPFLVVTNQSSNSFDFTRYNINNVRFYINQGGVKSYIPLDSEFKGITITQVRNQYVYGFPARSALSANVEDFDSSGIPNNNNSFYVSLSYSAYQNFGLTVLIYAEYADGHSTTSTEGAVGNSIALSLIESPVYTAKDITVSGENVLGGNSCPSNTLRTKIADFCISNSLSNWQNKINAGAGITYLPAGRDNVSPFDYMQSLSQPIASVKFSLKNTQTSADIGTISISQSQAQEMLHYQKNERRPYYVNLKTFRLALADDSPFHILDGSNEVAFSKNRAFFIHLNGLPYGPNFSIVKSENNDQVTANPESSLNVNCYDTFLRHRRIENPFAYYFNQYKNRSLDLCRSVQVSGRNLNCNPDEAGNYYHPTFTRIPNARGIPLKDWETAWNKLIDFQNEYLDYYNSMYSNAVNFYKHGAFNFNFNSNVCTQLVSGQRDSSADYKDINPTFLQPKPAQITLLIKVTDDYGNTSQIAYPIGFQIAENGLYYLTFN